MGRSPSINMPAQASYSEAMADSLKAQVDLLRGSGDFADTGGLRELVTQYEAPLRQATAQIETDTLRQTILGSGSDEKYAPDGRIIVGYEEPPAGGAGGGASNLKMQTRYSFDPGAGLNGIETVTYQLIDTTTGKEVTRSQHSRDESQFDRFAPQFKENAINTFQSEGYLTPEQADIAKAATYPDALVFGDASSGGGVSEATPIYKKDSSGNDIVAAAGSFTPGGSVGRAGDGMIDILGDSRKLAGQNRAAGF